MGVTVIKSLKEKHAERIALWLESDSAVQRNYPDGTEALVNDMVYANATVDDPFHNYISHDQFLVTKP
jgi:hypothetical protein